MNLKVETLEDIFKMAHLHKLTEILKIGIKLGLFEMIGNGCRDLDSLCGKLVCNREVLELVLKLFVKTGLLEFDDGKYSNSELAVKYLTGKQNLNLSDLLLYNSESKFSADGLIEAFFGKSLKGDKSNDIENYMRAMHIGGRHTALSIARKIKGKNKKILDLGCGSGIFSIAICKTNRTAEAYLVDRENVLEITRKNIEDENLSERVTCIASDILTFDSEEKYDYILLANVLHFYDVDTIKKILMKYCKYLNSDGKLFIYDTFNNFCDEYSLLYLSEWLSEGVYFVGVDNLPEIMSEIGYKDIVLENTMDTVRKLLIAGVSV